MGCWAIGGPFWFGDIAAGYSGAADDESLRAIHAAWDHGIRVFDTSAVYGAGHSERLLGEALARRGEAVIVSKFGHSIDAETRQLTGPRFDPAYVRESVEQSLRRLGRDHIDVMLLHLNDLPVADAEPAFETLEAFVAAGAIGSYGWSTDFPASAGAMARRLGFSTVQHSMNLFFDAPSMCRVAMEHGLTQLIRSPLGMGVLTGKFDDGRVVPEGDVRVGPPDWQGYFDAGRPRPDLARQMAAVRELLTVGGRTLAQGALCWLLAKGPGILPIPGAKSAAQATENAGAMALGPLPEPVMLEIERLLQRPPEGSPRAR
ncbi:aldo/keto reductase [Ancylobacter sp. A5.8]|uniref:aldo/keto reductase n=1 Tax=Ancylobacter gelatini TaxID=2919920 RepID=UPI001F4D5EA8|nr:aldo/keto reductase [Ancylobacter gelatini]MCJ8142327.1 aldo/keto reductase [Ancylobacter gelatini]